MKQWDYKISKDEAERNKRDHEENERYEVIRCERKMEYDETERIRIKNLNKLEELQNSYEN